MNEHNALCVAVDSDMLEEGVSRLRSGYAILSDAYALFTGDEWLCDKLYGAEILIREALEMLSDCRTDTAVFDVTALSVALKRKGAKA